MSTEQADALIDAINNGTPFPYGDAAFEGGFSLSSKEGHMEHHLTVLINGFNLDCQNCLNGTCAMRDPDQPLR